MANVYSFLFLASTAVSFFSFYYFRNKFSNSFFKRLGGLVVALITLLGMTGVYFLNDYFNFPFKDFLSIWIAQLVIIAGGITDDRFNLKPAYQFLFQTVAVLVVVIAENTIRQVNLPVIGIVQLNIWVDVFTSFVWIILVVNAFNWVDGVDGLAGGVGLIGFLMIFFLSLTPIVSQPHTAAISIIIGGALLGFLPYNLKPAKVYLGSVGTGFIGFMLAVVSIFSGGKIATASLVLGILILDFVYVFFSRLKKGIAPWKGGDREHLHYKLLDIGVSEKKVVFFAYLFSFGFGLIALTLQTELKLMGFWLALLLFSLITVYISREKARLNAKVEPNAGKQKRQKTD